MFLSKRAVNRPWSPFSPGTGGEVARRADEGEPRSADERRWNPRRGLRRGTPAEPALGSIVRTVNRT